MATKTEIYELRKKEENDFYNVEDFNNNMDTLEKALTEFDDTGTAEGVTSFPEMLTKLVTGNKLAITLKNLKAGLQFVLHAGSIVNNCVTDNANLPVSAAMAKSLQDQINQANSNLAYVDIDMSSASVNTEVSANYPTGFNRTNSIAIGIAGVDKNYSAWYGYLNDDVFFLTLGNRIVVKTTSSAYVGSGAKIRVLLMRIK